MKTWFLSPNQGNKQRKKERKKKIQIKLKKERNKLTN